MPRLGRVVVPGIPHHITQRGVRREDVFYSQEDRWRYLEFLAQAAERFGVAVWSWCLMTNHVHVVAVPEEERSVIERKADPLVKPNKYLDEMIGDWRAYLLEPQGAEILRELRSETPVGRPLGSKQFVTQLEQDLNRSLTRLPPGRPRKKVSYL